MDHKLQATVQPDRHWHATNFHQFVKGPDGTHCQQAVPTSMCKPFRLNSLSPAFLHKPKAGRNRNVFTISQGSRSGAGSGRSGLGLSEACQGRKQQGHGKCGFHGSRGAVREALDCICSGTPVRQPLAPSYLIKK